MDLFKDADTPSNDSSACWAQMVDYLRTIVIEYKNMAALYIMQQIVARQWEVIFDHVLVYFSFLKNEIEFQYSNMYFITNSDVCIEEEQNSRAFFPHSTGNRAYMQ